jgi:hypothetical protein
MTLQSLKCCLSYTTNLLSKLQILQKQLILHIYKGKMSTVVTTTNHYMEISCQLQVPTTFPASAHQKGGWVGSRAGLNVAEKRKISVPAKK